ncbi:hypothetical protein HBN50_07675 [Halobacteriovorax sp. GB3]|uniref:hypothetical protein n=1 Tax=Halobacteriovorax sp. GB3 TaxID=2719615 RepID=UPI002361E326|nr:hypothetical protein [Halobacteriovorax sp. GB3]MDD0852970.1 hypothetical protein [Halobacteriovorax sp. GB3]
MKKNAIITLSVSVVLLIGLGLFTRNLETKNNNKIFLTDQEISHYNERVKDLGEFNSLIVLVDKEKRNEVATLVTRHCEDCSLFNPSELDIKNELTKKLDQEQKEAVFISSESEQDLFNLVELTTTKDYSFLGVPYTNYLLNEYSKDISKKLFPLMFIFSLILLIFLTRKLKDGITLFIPCLSSALISLSLLKIFYSSMSMVNSISPLLVFVVNLSVVFHLYYSYIEYRDWDAVFSDKIKPLVLMLITTCLGLLSLEFSEISAIRDFGRMGALSLVLSCAFTWAYFYFSRFHFIGKRQVETKVSSIVTNALDLCASFPNRLVFVFLFPPLIAISFFMSQTVPTITDANLYFPDSDQRALSMHKVSETVGGQPLFDITIDLKDRSMESLNEFLGLERRLQEKSFMKSYKLVSETSLVSEINREYSESESLPVNEMAYLALRSKIPVFFKDQFPLENKYRFFLIGHATNVDVYEKDLEKITKFYEKNNTQIKAGGLYHHLMISQKSMIKTMIKSFLFSVLVISFLALVYYRSIKVFMAFAIVNVGPVLFSFLISSPLGLSYNIATVMTYSIALGIVVDSSFHLVHFFSKADRSIELYKKAIIRPILGSTFVLVLCFLLIGSNSFVPIGEFGLNLAIIIFLGAIFDLFIFPSFLVKDVNEVFSEKVS